MKISLSYFSNISNFLLEEMSVSLNDQNKKIVVIAVAGFAFLATCYMLIRHCFKAEKKNPQEGKKNIGQEKSESDWWNLIGIDPNVYSERSLQTLQSTQEKARFFQYIAMHGSKIEKLNFDTITEEELREIVIKCPHLKELTIAETEITDVALVHLKPLPLETLRLYNCKQLTNKGLAHLTSISSLISLDLRKCDQLTGEGLTYLTPLSSLENLKLIDFNQLSDENLAHLTALPLKFLTLVHCGSITGRGFAYLPDILESLTLIECKKVDDDGFAHLPLFSSLKNIELDGCNGITNASLVRLKSFPSLDGLDLSNCDQVTDDGLIHLQPLISLTSLSLENLKITDEGLRCLKNFHSLSFLSLRGCRLLTDEGLQFLETLSHLNILNLEKCPLISVTGLKSLAKKTVRIFIFKVL